MGTEKTKDELIHLWSPSSKAWRALKSRPLTEGSIHKPRCRKNISGKKIQLCFPYHNNYPLKKKSTDQYKIRQVDEWWKDDI